MASVYSDPAVATKAERRAARERVAAYHQTELARLVEFVARILDIQADEGQQIDWWSEARAQRASAQIES
jgi:hypothetical protein